MLTSEQISDWKKSGIISRDALLYGKSLITKGAKMLDVLNKIEAKIKELG